MSIGRHLDYVIKHNNLKITDIFTNKQGLPRGGQILPLSLPSNPDMRTRMGLSRGKYDELPVPVKQVIEEIEIKTPTVEEAKEAKEEDGERSGEAEDDDVIPSVPTDGGQPVQGVASPFLVDLGDGGANHSLGGLQEAFESRSASPPRAEGESKSAEGDEQSEFAKLIGPGWEGDLSKGVRSIVFLPDDTSFHPIMWESANAFSEDTGVNRNLLKGVTRNGDSKPLEVEGHKGKILFVNPKELKARFKAHQELYKRLMRRSKRKGRKPSKAAKQEEPKKLEEGAHKVEKAAEKVEDDGQMVGGSIVKIVVAEEEAKTP